MGRQACILEKVPLSTQLTFTTKIAVRWDSFAVQDVWTVCSIGLTMRQKFIGSVLTERGKCTSTV